MTDEKTNGGFTLRHQALESIFPAFEHLRESIFLFDQDKENVYCNQSAKEVFAFKSTLTEEDKKRLSEIFHPVIETHKATLNDDSIVRTDSSLVTYAETKLQTPNGRTFRALLHTTTLVGEKHTVLGYAINLIDLSEITVLENILSQGKRVETFSLYALSVSMPVLQKSSAGILISPLSRMDEWIEQQPIRTRLSTSVTTLTECFDFLVSTEISIKVRIAEDTTLAVREAHFLQLLAHMALHAARFVGTGGEIMISASAFEPNVGVTLMLEAESRNALAPRTEDPIAKLIFEETNLPTPGEATQGSQIPTGLVAAQAVAAKYRSQIEYQHSTDILRMRVRLPQSGSAE